MSNLTLNKTRRLHALLANGYFPKELPPPFNTRDFAKYRKSVGDSWNNGNNYPKSKSEIYTVPRIGNWRRDLSIVNPVAQFYLSSLIADEWIEIRKHINKNSFSAQHLEIADDKTRSIEEPDFRLLAMLKSEISGIYDFALVSDISRFYGTLYTHAIPWALHGKSHCKAILDTPAYKHLLGTKLDRAVRKGNENQTAGIPIGPDTSRILSEIVVSEVDRRLTEKLAIKKTGAIRNVDDWFIGFDTLSRAEENIAVLSSACNFFQLEIHPEKTKSIELTKLFSPLWTDELLSLVIPKSGKAQQRKIEHFFELAFDLSIRHSESNVLKFAITLARSWKVERSNWRIFENFLLRVARANKTVFPQFVQLVANYREMDFEISEEKMRKLVEDILRAHVPIGSHFEISWALFLVKALQLTVDAKILKDVCKLESSVCALIVLDLRDKGLISGNLDESVWLQSMTKSGLDSEMWLLAYEADLKGWLPSPNPNHVQSHFYFNELNKRKISFYNDKKNVRLLSKEKPRPVSPELLALTARLRGITLEELANLDVSSVPPIRFSYSTYGD